MTCDERLEALLNRAGQTISDLPRREGTEASEPYPLSGCPKANGAAWRWYLDIDTDMDDHDTTRTKMVLKLYILHLTDIIDRLETALENVCGERDYLRYWMKQDWVKQGICERCPKGVDYRYKGYSCAFCDYMEDGVPEDWSADDE